MSFVLTRAPWRKKRLIFITAVVFILAVNIRAAAVRIEERSIAALAWNVAGRLIVIDPGHGGEDPGALGRTGVPEKEIVLEVSKKLALFLQQAGAQVLLTRDSDRDLCDPNLDSMYQRKVQDLERRVKLANQRQADLFISVHINSFPDSREDGAQAFSQPGSSEGKKLAEAIQHEMNKFLENPGRLAKQVDYYTIRLVKMPGAIVEIGFISNPREERLLLDPQYQQKVAWAVYAGIVRYFSQASPALAEADG